MTDIVEQLREAFLAGEIGIWNILPDAAEEIMQLREMLNDAVRERENYNGSHQQACIEIERLRAALTRISNGGTAVLISAALDECQINPEVLEQIVKDAVAALPPSCTCGSDTGQPAIHHDISCPSAISSTERGTTDA